MKVRAKRYLATGVGLLMATTGLVAASSMVASADTIGTLTFDPATGTSTSAIDVTTSGGCPTGTEAITGRIFGSGFPSEGYGVIGNTTAGVSTEDPFTLPLAKTLADFAGEQTPPATLSGEYQIQVMCQDLFGLTEFGDFTSSIWFTSATTYQSTDPSVQIETETSLAVSPLGTSTFGDPVTLTATVDPAAAPGEVTFFDGSTELDTVPVVAGAAELVVTTLGVGSHSLTAEFVPGAGYQGSTSAAVPHEVTPGVSGVSLAVTPATSATAGQLVTLTATVTPSSATGTVQFFDGATPLGTPQPVVGGQASYQSAALPVGTYTFSAAFDSTTPGVDDSTSADVPYEITAFTGVSTHQDITTTVEAGALVISVDDDTVLLPSPVLTPEADLLVTNGPINPVTVTDTRAGALGWTASGQVGDFVSPSSNEINGANLGWEPTLDSKSAAQVVNLGPVVPPADGVAPGAPSTEGLKSSRTLASAPAGASNGTAVLGAELTLHAPTTTLAGTYTATLTLTAI